MTLIGYDSATPSFSTPNDPQFIVCYGDLHYENEAAAHARFPELTKAGRVVDLTARSALWKDPFSGADIEPGNAGPSTAAGYVKGEHALGVTRPDVYADLSDMRTVIALLEQAGIAVGPAGPSRPWRMYTAHPTGHEHICGPSTCGFPWEADITQFFWSSLSGEWRGFKGDLDVNAAREDAFAQPVPADPFHYGWYQRGPFPYKGEMLNERAIVQEYDKLRATQTWHTHPHRARLAQLREWLEFLAKRVAYEAHKNNPRASIAHALATGPYHDGFRFQGLVRRAQGERLV